jgi:nucleoside-diphosphate-sugar epimerase
MFGSVFGYFRGTVLVIDASSSISQHIIQLLLKETTYNVRTTISNLENLKTLEFLTSLPNAADRLVFEKTGQSTEEWTEVLKGCIGLMCCYDSYSKELIELSLTGGSIQHIILLSTIGTTINSIDLIEGATVTEGWNQNEKTGSILHSAIAMEWESLSLVKLAQKNGSAVRLVILNAGIALGPCLDPNDDKPGLVKNLYMGKLPHTKHSAKSSLAIVDIRDVAQAFVLALENKDGFAEGRFLLSSQVWTLTRIIEYFKELHPGKNLPTIPTSKILSISNKMFGGSRNDYCEKDGELLIFGQGKFLVDTSRAEGILGLKYRTVEETLDDSIANIIKDPVD